MDAETTKAVAAAMEDRLTGKDERWGSISGQTGAKIDPGENLETFLDEAGKAQGREKGKAKYKIELHFSRHRKPNKGVPSPAMVLIWESGKKYHGGGDQKMYWCGHDDCGKPFSSDNFGYMHVVCPKCHREMFLDPKAKDAHAQDMMERGLDPAGLGKVPFVVGEKLVNLTPIDLATLLEKTWRQLDGDSDIYIKFSPHDIRYHKGANDIDIAEQLRVVRTARQPLIYPLTNIIKDLHAGASLHARFVALLTS
jgi:hypothetical protein